MLLPPFWRGRAKHVPAKDRLARLHSVIAAAQSHDAYRIRLEEANLSKPDALPSASHTFDSLLAKLRPLPFAEYRQLFRTRKPALNRVPELHETRSAAIVPFAVARAGFQNHMPEITMNQDPYSPQNLLNATADLFRLAKSLSSVPNQDHRQDLAIALFSGVDAGTVSPDQLDWLWNTYQVPLFQQFVGTDGRVVAAECDAHDGLHVLPEHAHLESVAGEIALTSLTDSDHPALRVLTGFQGELNTEPCECGRTEIRLQHLQPRSLPQAKSATA